MELACLLVLAMGSAATANAEGAGPADVRPASLREEVVSAAKPGCDVEPKQAPIAVLEIPERWLPALSDRPFEVRLPVDVWALGTRVRGASRVVGHYTIRCIEGEGALCFEIAVRGTSTAETRSHKRAVTIRTTTVTQFEARKRIERREGKFVAGPTSVEAMHTLSVRSRIEPHGRIGQRIVVRAAQERMQRQHDEIQTVRRRLTEQRILDAVDQSVEQTAETADRLLRHVRMVALSRGWNGSALPLQLQTREGFLRLAWCRDDPAGSGPVFATVAGSRLGIAGSVFHLLAAHLREGALSPNGFQRRGPRQDVGL